MAIMGDLGVLCVRRGIEYTQLCSVRNDSQMTSTLNSGYILSFSALYKVDKNRHIIDDQGC